MQSHVGLQLAAAVCLVGVVRDERDALGRLASADEDVVVTRAGRCAVVEGDVALELQAFERALFGVSVNAPAVLSEDKVVADELRALLVLRVDAVAVAAVGLAPAVVEDDVAVKF